MTDTGPDPVFEAPWHAQVFALTVHLSEQGVFSWPDWTARFGAILARDGLARDLDGGDDYFLAWVATLEDLLQQRGLAEAAALAGLKTQWENAYLSTPHGQPVRLG